jgi:hypothetical protein
MKTCFAAPSNIDPDYPATNPLTGKTLSPIRQEGRKVTDRKRIVSEEGGRVSVIALAVNY